MTRLFQLNVAKYLETPNIKVWRFGNPSVFQAILISLISPISFVSMVLYSFGPASNDYELMTFATKVHIVHIVGEVCCTFRLFWWVVGQWQSLEISGLQMFWRFLCYLCQAEFDAKECRAIWFKWILTKKSIDLLARQFQWLHFDYELSIVKSGFGEMAVSPVCWTLD